MRRGMRFKSNLDERRFLRKCRGVRWPAEDRQAGGYEMEAIRRYRRQGHSLYMLLFAVAYQLAGNIPKKCLLGGSGATLDLRIIQNSQQNLKKHLLIISVIIGLSPLVITLHNPIHPDNLWRRFEDRYGWESLCVRPKPTGTLTLPLSRVSKDTEERRGSSILLPCSENRAAPFPYSDGAQLPLEALHIVLPEKCVRVGEEILRGRRTTRLQALRPDRRIPIEIWVDQDLGIFLKVSGPDSSYVLVDLKQRKQRSSLFERLKNIIK
jgi:hypothetical protein